MIHIDSAVEMLRNTLDNYSDLSAVLNGSTENFINYNVSKGNITINVWFDAQKQVFGFDMLQGGCKTYEKVTDCVNFARIYLNLNADFIPKSKIIADEFENELGINTIYDNFVGNEQKGYTAIFRVLGLNNKAVHIRRIGANFNARLVQLASDDPNKFSSELSRTYSLSEDGTVNLVIDLDLYFEKICDLYENNDDILIDRTSSEDYIFRVGSLRIETKVCIIDNRIVYEIQKLSGVEIKKSIDIDNPFDLNMVYLECKQAFDDYNAKEEESFIIPDTSLFDPKPDVVGFGYINEEIPIEETNLDNGVSFGDVDFGSTSTEFDEEKVEETIISGYVAAEESTVEEVEQVVKEVELIVEEPKYEIKQEIISMNFAMYKVMLDDTVQSVQIVMDGNLYTMSIDKAKALGIPVERITRHTNLLSARVIAMTELEKEHKAFATDISDDDVLCSSILTKLFE